LAGWPAPGPTAPPEDDVRRAHPLRWTLLAALGVSLAVLVPRLLRNVHEVVPGVVLRSAQLSPTALEEVVAGHGVRSVVNLRGARPGRAWYDDELAVCARAGVAHFDFELSAEQDVPLARARDLVQLMASAPKPLLLHCQGGADRTGLASALYRVAVMRETPERAATELSTWYGHLPWLWSPVEAMDRSYARFVDGGVEAAGGGPGDGAR
jgi:protein tyrosine phosphatase (PTP) superfamily phosphohydrolase (DUF442 family)